MPYERKADRIMKRFLALLLCMLMCMGMLPVAAFAEGEHAIIVNTENGSITPSTSSAEAGTIIALNITPAPGYELVPGSITAVDAENTTVAVTSNTFVMPDSDVTVTASFRLIPTYTVTVTTPTNGSVTPNKASGVKRGETVTLTVTPSTGYELDTLTVTGSSGTVEVNNNQFVMPDSNVTVVASFKVSSKYKVTVSPTPANGTVSADKSSASEGETVSLTIEPNENYILDSLKVVNKTTGKSITLSGNQFKMPASDVTVSATFKKIRIVSGDGGTAHYGSPYSFAVNTDLEDIDSVRVKIDGEWITSDRFNRDKANGKTIVTLRRAYISGYYLTEGKHSIEIVTNIGKTGGSFWVSKSPKTGDDSNVALWVTVGVISAAGVAGIAYYLLKKRKK